MSEKKTAICLVLILLVSAYSVTNFLPADSIFNSSSIYTDDYSFHFSQCLAAKRFLLTEGKTWGYDPFFLAGFPRCTLLDVDNKAYELFVLLFSFLSDGFAFKLYLIFFIIIFPFLLYFAAINFGLAIKESLFASILSILLFYLTIAVDMVSWGMISYVFASHLSIYVFSILYKWLHRPFLRQYIILLLVSSFLFLMHIISPVLLFVPALAIYLINFKRMQMLHHVMILILVIIVLVFNSFWLFPLSEFYHQIMPYEDMGGYLPLQIYNIWEPFHVYVRQDSIYNPRPDILLNNPFFEVVLFLFAIAGFYIWLRDRKTKLILSFLSAVIFFFIVSYYGSHTDFFTKLHPQRFLIPLNIYLVIPASIGINLFFKRIFQNKSLAFRVFVVCLSFVLLVYPVVRPLNLIFRHKIYRLSCEFPQPVKNILDWIKNNTDKSARILIEDSEFDSGHQYYGGHFPALFPEYVKREYLCGPRPYYPVKQGFASFTSGMLFERRINDYTFQELQEYFNLYNVKWIVCWSVESIKVFDRYPEYLRKKVEIDKFTIYEANRKSSFFLKGDGIIKSDYNRFELSSLIADNGEVIIKYHWMEYFKTKPHVEIKRVSVPGDPVGFIKILHPPESLTLFNGY